MKRNIRLYFEIQYANLRSRMAYPLNFFIGITSITFLGLSYILFAWVITRRVPYINGWGLYELVFMTSMWRTSHGVFVSTFQQCWDMDGLIRNGEMDRYFVRPLNPLLQFATNRVQILGFGDVIAGIIGLFYAIPHITVWTFGKAALFAVMLVSGTLIEWSLFMMIGCLTFWTMQGGALRGILDTFMSQFTRFPLTIFHWGIQITLTFIVPIAFMSYYPSYLFFGDTKQIPFSPVMMYLSPVAAVLLVAAAYKVWNKGLNAYKGAGS